MVEDMLQEPLPPKSTCHCESPLITACLQTMTSQHLWDLTQKAFNKHKSSSKNNFKTLQQGFSKSGLRSGSGPGGNSIRTRLHLIFQVHSDLRVRGAHTHTSGRMNQCCSDYRLFCKTKHIATSNILDKPSILFSRIMSPVSPRKREVSPPPSDAVFLHRQS